MQRQVGFSQTGLDRLDNFHAREIAAKRVPGAVVAIARDGKLVHYKAYGQLDAARGTPMPLDAVFALASMTKPMAAVAGLTLMEQGRLPPQARLSDYYPGFADMKVGTTQADGSLKTEAQASPWQARQHAANCENITASRSRTSRMARWCDDSCYHRHSGMVRRTRPGISRFRFDASHRPGMTC